MILNIFKFLFIYLPALYFWFAVIVGLLGYEI